MATIIQKSFTGGELTPLMDARSDQSRYKTGGRTMKNGLLFPHGTFSRRPGFRFIASQLSQDNKAKLVPFEFSTEQAYVLEFGLQDTSGQGYMRVFKDKAQVWVDATDSALVAADWDDVSAAASSMAKQGEDIAPDIHTDNLTTVGAGWTIDDDKGQAYAVTAGAGIVFDVELSSGVAYTITYRVANYSAGNVQASVPGDTGATTAADGYYSEVLTPTSDGALTLTGDGFTGDITLLAIQSGDSDDGITLFCDGTNAAIAEQDVTHTSDDVEHVMTFIVVDGPVKVRVGTTSGAEDILEETERSAGFHSVAFTPPTGNTTFYVQFYHDSGDSSRSLKNIHFLNDEPVAIPTPFTSVEQLFCFGRSQSADVMYIVHKQIAPHKVMRYGHNVWQIREVNFGPDIDAPLNLAATVQGTTGSEEYSYVVTAVDEDTDEESLRSIAATVTTGHAYLDETNYVELTWDTVSGAKHYNVYRLKDGIDAYLGKSGDGLFHDVGAKEPNEEETPPISKNPFTDEENWPSVVTFYEQRLAFARGQRIRLSQTANYENMNTSNPLKDDDACSFRIASDRVNEIQWLAPGKRLFFGTTGGEWTLQGEGGKAITPSNPDIKRQSVRGCAALPPLTIGNILLFAQNPGTVIREFKYTLEDDGYETSDLSILSEHMLLGDPAVDWAFQQMPLSTAYVVTESGQLLALCYNREHEIIGWTRMETDGLVESVCSIPGDPDNELWISVRRYVNGQWRRYVECLDPIFRDEWLDHAFFMDSGLTYNQPVTMTGFTQADPVVVTAPGHGFSSGDTVRITEVMARFVQLEDDDNSPREWTGENEELNRKKFLITVLDADTFSLQDEDGDDIDGTGFPAYFEGGVVRKCISQVTGADHLEGKQVQVLGDGAELPSVIVTGGVVDLGDAKASIIHVGLPYATDLMPMKPDISDENGTIQNKIKRITRAWVRVYRSLGVKFGPDETELRAEPIRSDLYKPGMALPSITTDIELEVDGGYDPETMFMIRQDKPLPLNVVALIMELEVGD